ncbi:CaiB/BaiF CoA transferase family protein [Marinobacter sp. F3R11]|uniref:CaiB/BaiF CoA transferase family protein n=1 Tax=Marinobacter sp. F3R11 TaxID=2267231 RepID=UPI000DEACA9D|nr:CoA transferase [Marinobacter sp. F3R11]RBW51253.1 CoA transferase [Marinobacter sp. F3R11]
MSNKTPELMPFRGIRVLDVSQGLAGPYATQMLAMMGASVLKVEPPQGDWGRLMGLRKQGHSALSVSANWNKRSICIDARTEEGVEVLKQLATQSDLVMESFRPGVMDKLGLGFEVLNELRPGIILGSISGFGRLGPYAGRPGSDSILQGITGMSSMNSGADGQPQRVGMLAVDMITGLYAGYALSAALYQQKLTGEGRHLDLSLLAGASAFQAMPIIESFLQDGQRSAHVTVPSGTFDASDGAISVACLRDGMFYALAEVLGHPEWQHDSRFADNESRQVHAAEIHRMMAEVFVSRPRLYWIDRLNEAGVLCGPLNSYADLLCDPQVQSLDLMPEVSHKAFGKIPLPRFPGAEPVTENLKPAPDLGEHTYEVLREAGYDEEKITSLVQSKACIQAPTSNDNN